jgi:hypothetical protein
LLEANVEVSKGGIVLLPSRTHVPFKGVRELTRQSGCCFDGVDDLLVRLTDKRGR